MPVAGIQASSKCRKMLGDELFERRPFEAIQLGQRALIDAPELNHAR
jgi:hypothetical protein